MRHMLWVALLCSVSAGCKSNFNNGFAVGLRVLADGSVASRTVTLHVDVAGVETFHSDSAASAKFVSSGEERILYRPGATAGMLDFSVEARDANQTALATGQARGVVLLAGETVPVDVQLVSSTSPPDLFGVDLFGVDLFTAPGDLAGADLTMVCTPSNTSCLTTTTLRTCSADGTGFVDTDCALGCAATPFPHCKQVVPSATGVTTADLDGTGLGDVALINNTTLDSDTGEITGVRVANANPSVREVISGIAFHRATVAGTTIGIFSFNSFVMGDGKTLVLKGSIPVALTSAGDMTILGILDGRGPCSGSVVGPGGGKGGSVAGVATGPGKGTLGASNASDATSGGGGGGYGDNGGSTTQIGVGQTTLGGVNYGNATLVPLLAGSGGGRGGDGNSATTTGGLGGNGGGAIQLVAAGVLTIGTGSSPGGINFGGCGGAGASMPAGVSGGGAGGGGGSGGAALVEAPTVNISSFGAIVVNGGAGGGGALGVGVAAQAGFPASFTTDQTGTHGSMAFSASCGNGGFGGAAVVGTSVPKGQGGASGGTGGCTGGGGGGAGRIRINSLTGSATLSGGGYTSPHLGDMSSHAEALATQGMVTTQ